MYCKMEKGILLKKIEQEKEHVLIYKILYSAMIMLIYMVGRNIPLYGVDVSYYQNIEVNAQTIMMQAMTGDMQNCSMFILGLWPYMMSSMLIMIVVAIISLDKTKKISPKKMNRWTLVLALVFSGVQAFGKVQSLVYAESQFPVIVTKCIVFVELITGMLVVMYMCERATKYGIGGRTSVFIVNILEGILTMFIKTTPEKLVLPLIISIAGVVIMLILETTEKRIAVQRVSIHNIYADKDYIAYKLNPTGAMPLMFTSVVFLIPQMICMALEGIAPENQTIKWVADNMTLTKTLGIWVYMAIICILTVLFAFIMLSPGNMADNLLKTGDSILDIYAGKQTKKYLVWNVLALSLFSSVIVAAFQGIPLFLQFGNHIDPSLVMLPCSIMMFTGMWVSLFREAVVYRNMDRYKAFI